MAIRKALHTEGEMLQALCPVNEALNASETRYRRLFENAQDGILIIDISQRKKAEKSSFIFESRLKQGQKMAAIATLAGGIAHQFNNAITVFTGGLGMLEAGGCYQETGRYLSLMKAAADKMSRLTQPLSAYARGRKYSPETMLARDLVRCSLSMRDSVFKPSIAVETELPSGLPQIYVDGDQMLLALRAILANASEAIDTQGVVRITCRKEVMTSERVKNFAGLRPGVYVSLTIRDNGKGMDPETRDRVFEPFFKAHFPGRGLGMASI